MRDFPWLCYIVITRWYLRQARCENGGSPTCRSRRSCRSWWLSCLAGSWVSLGGLELYSYSMVLYNIMILIITILFVIVIIVIITIFASLIIIYRYRFTIMWKVWKLKFLTSYVGNSCKSSRVSWQPGPVQWPFQGPIDWRYLPYIRPSYKAYVREYPSKIWPKIWYSTSILGSWNSHWNDHGTSWNKLWNYHENVSRAILLVWTLGKSRPRF